MADNSTSRRLKVLVTGAQGLLGAELCQQLYQQGHYVVAADNGFRGTVNPECHEFLDFNLANSDYSILPTDIDVIYHFGAINGTRYFYEIPNELLVNNLTSDFNIFNWAKTCANLKSIVYASSSEVPVDSTDGEISEIKDIYIKNIHNPRWSYRLGKICAENYLTNSTLPYVIVRYFNVYGKNSQSGHFVYDIAKKILTNNFSLIGSNETRSYCHVSDAVDATIKITFAHKKIINVGSDEELQTVYAANIIANALKKEVSSWADIPSRAGSTQRRKPNIQLLQTIYPEYRPITFKEGVSRIIDTLIDKILKEQNNVK